jgi:hypothetical protein
VKDTIIRASGEMRLAGGAWFAVAEWLSNVAFRAWGIGLPVAQDHEIKHATAVADAYLTYRKPE